MVKKFFFILCAAAFAALIPAPVPASPLGKAAAHCESPFLKINDYVVLYLNPAAPYRDKRGTLVAPVKLLAALLGVDTKTTPDGNTVTLTGNGHTVAFTVGTPIQAGIKPYSYFPPFRWHGTGEIIVPVEDVANGLGIRQEWDPEHRVLQLHSSDALADQEDNLHGFPFGGFLPDPAISVVSFRMTVSSRPSRYNQKGLETEHPYRCWIVLRNGSTRTILDDSVVDVIEEHASDTRGDSIGKPGSRREGTETTQPLIKVSPGGTYHLSTAGSPFHPIETVLIAVGSRIP